MYKLFSFISFAVGLIAIFILAILSIVQKNLFYLLEIDTVEADVSPFNVINIYTLAVPIIFLIVGAFFAYIEFKGIDFKKKMN
ncbi:hypothetical protein [Listeria sp. PSOL-1]|uniref:hypothetical protein n=1 Tax=Listeria sp. PSOL-1 TaxID=1844999 RepID=UPI0013D0D507|nr:hypothetical protein [Listeria sp. PSOL-1]